MMTLHKRRGESPDSQTRNRKRTSLFMGPRKLRTIFGAMSERGEAASVSDETACNSPLSRQVKTGTGRHKYLAASRTAVRRAEQKKET